MRYHDLIQVGTTVIAKVATLLGKPGAAGVCYRIDRVMRHQDFDFLAREVTHYAVAMPSEDYHFIFEGGRHDAFTPNEIDELLLVCDRDTESAHYRYQGEKILVEDFQKGFFREALALAHRQVEQIASAVIEGANRGSRKSLR